MHQDSWPQPVFILSNMHVCVCMHNIAIRHIYSTVGMNKNTDNCFEKWPLTACGGETYLHTYIFNSCVVTKEYSTWMPICHTQVRHARIDGIQISNFSIGNRHMYALPKTEQKGHCSQDSWKTFPLNSSSESAELYFQDCFNHNQFIFKWKVNNIEKNTNPYCNQQVYPLFTYTHGNTVTPNIRLHCTYTCVLYHRAITISMYA